VTSRRQPGQPSTSSPSSTRQANRAVFCGVRPVVQQEPLSFVTTRVRLLFTQVPPRVRGGAGARGGGPAGREPVGLRWAGSAYRLGRGAPPSSPGYFAPTFLLPYSVIFFSDLRLISLLSLQRLAFDDMFPQDGDDGLLFHQPSEPAVHPGREGQGEDAHGPIASRPGGL
jgi:hypothetical protein